MVTKVNFITMLQNRFLHNGRQTNQIINHLKRQSVENLYMRKYKAEDILGNKTVDCIALTGKKGGDNCITVIKGDEFIADKVSSNNITNGNIREYTAEKVYKRLDGMGLKEVNDKRISVKGLPSEQVSRSVDIPHNIKTFVHKTGNERITTTEYGNIKKVSKYSLADKITVDKYYMDGEECTQEMAELGGLV